MIAPVHLDAERTSLLGILGTIGPVLLWGYRTGARLGFVGTGRPGEPFGNRSFQEPRG